MWRRTVRREDAARAAKLRAAAAEQLEAERETTAERAQLADQVRAGGAQNGFSEAMERLYRRHLGATP
jgi:hypothetical protein